MEVDVIKTALKIKTWIETTIEHVPSTADTFSPGAHEKASWIPLNDLMLKWTTTD